MKIFNYMVISVVATVASTSFGMQEESDALLKLVTKNHLREIKGLATGSTNDSEGNMSMAAALAFSEFNECLQNADHKITTQEGKDVLKKYQMFDETKGRIYSSILAAFKGNSKDSN